jgi:hypothetical protein
LGLGAIYNRGSFERRELAFFGKRMVILEEEGCNVFLHGELAGAHGVVPGKFMPTYRSPFQFSVMS